MDAGSEEVLDPVAGGCGLLTFGAVILIASFFMDRADDYFYEVADNHLLQYSVFGPVFAGLLVAAVFLVFFSLKKRGPIGPVLLLLISLTLLAMTIIASKHLGLHPTDMGNLDNEADPGTFVSIAGSGLMVLGSLIAVGGAIGRSRT